MGRKYFPERLRVRRLGDSMAMYNVSLKVWLQALLLWWVSALSYIYVLWFVTWFQRHTSWWRTILSSRQLAWKQRSTITWTMIFTWSACSSALHGPAASSTTSIRRCWCHQFQSHTSSWFSFHCHSDLNLGRRSLGQTQCSHSSYFRTHIHPSYFSSCQHHLQLPHFHICQSRSICISNCTAAAWYQSVDARQYHWASCIGTSQCIFSPISSSRYCKWVNICTWAK